VLQGSSIVTTRITTVDTMGAHSTRLHCTALYCTAHTIQLAALYAAVIRGQTGPDEAMALVSAAARAAQLGWRIAVLELFAMFTCATSAERNILFCVE